MTSLPGNYIGNEELTKYFVENNVHTEKSSIFYL